MPLMGVVFYGAALRVERRACLVEMVRRGRVFFPTQRRILAHGSPPICRPRHLMERHSESAVAN